MKSKDKKCKECGETFAPQNSIQKVCSVSCAVKLNKNKTIKKVSKKRETENKIYAILRKKFLQDNPICPINKTQTTDIHHMKGRIGSLLLDTRYWLAVSREAHIMIEQNPVWAKENNYSLNRLSND